MYKELIKECTKHFTDQEILMIKKAYKYAEDLHRGQLRKSGEPYIIHPLHVAYITLTEEHLYNANSVVASLLHDCIEDTGITKEFIALHFNDDVANLVEGVTNISDTKTTFKKAQDQYDVAKVLLNILRDIRVALIKIADRVHNMRTLEYTKPEKQRYKAAETLSVYCPIALHLGINELKDELIDLSFRYLCASNGKEIIPEEKSTYYKIKKLREKHIECLQPDIETLEQEINSILQRFGINCRIRCKAKSNFNIYQLLASYRGLEEIPNLISFKIEVADLATCYETASILGKYFGILPEYTKDYIQCPDPNGYQAYHFSTLGKSGKPIRFKVFSSSMAEANRFGVASLIKPTENNFAEIQSHLTANNRFMHALQDNYALGEKPFEFIETTVRNLIADKIKVYDSNGDVHFLPNLSTVYDYACSLNFALDEDAIGALVNGVLVDLEFPLCPEDKIEIISSKPEKSLNMRVLKSEEGNITSS